MKQIIRVFPKMKAIIITAIAGFILYPIVARALDIIIKEPSCHDGRVFFTGETYSLMGTWYHYQCEECKKVFVVKR